MQGGQLVGIEQLGSLRVVLVQLADLAPRAANLGAGTVQHDLVGGVLPQHEVFDDFEQPLPLDGGVLLVLPVFEPTALLVAGIIDQLRKDDRPRRRQRPPRPPQMQSGRMPMPDRFLPRTGRIDGIQRQGDFDELAGGFDGVVGNGLNSLGAGEQCFDVVVDGGHAPAGFFLKRMRHVVRTVDGVIFAD